MMTTIPTEDAWYHFLAEHFGTPPASVPYTWHEDATLFNLGPNPPICLTVDQHCAGTHYQPAWLSPWAAGYRAVLRAANDILVKGARPLLFWNALMLPGSADPTYARAVIQGMAEAGRHLGMNGVGGDTTRGAVAGQTVIVLGRPAPRFIPRSSVQDGDKVYLLGRLGTARLGRALIARWAAAGLPPVTSLADLADPTRYTFVGLPPTLVPLGRVAVTDYVVPQLATAWDTSLTSIRGAHAAIDVSDGLLRDAGRLARASNVNITIEVERIAALPNIEPLAKWLGLDPTASCLTGGDDYAWLATWGSGVNPPSPPWQFIGQAHAATPEGGQVFLRLPSGDLHTPQDLGGWDIFSPQG